MFLTFTISAILFAKVQSNPEEICISPLASTTDLIKNTSNNNVIVGPRQTLGLVADDPNDLIANITNDWIGFGDGRTNSNDSNWPAVRDIPLEAASKFVGVRGSSLIYSMFGFPNKTDYVYQGCGAEKIFYEGASSINTGESCNFVSWATVRKAFYNLFYAAASKYRCLSLANVTVAYDKDYKVQFPTGGYAGTGNFKMASDNCSGTWLQNPLYYVNITLAYYSVCGSINDNHRKTLFTLPSTSNGQTCDEHLVELCYWTLPASFSYSIDCGGYYQYYTYSNGTNISVPIIDYRQGTPFSNAAQPMIVCNPILLKPGNYYALSNGYRVMAPSRSYCFGGGEASHIHVVQSVNATLDLLNDDLELACKANPKCIYHKKKSAYVATAPDGVNGDLEMRRRFEGLLQPNTTCTFSGGSFQGSSVSSSNYATPSIGKCPVIAPITIEYPNERSVFGKKSMIMNYSNATFINISNSDLYTQNVLLLGAVETGYKVINVLQTGENNIKLSNTAMFTHAVIATNLTIASVIKSIGKSSGLEFIPFALSSTNQTQTALISKTSDDIRGNLSLRFVDAIENVQSMYARWRTSNISSNGVYVLTPNIFTKDCWDFNSDVCNDNCFKQIFENEIVFTTPKPTTTLNTTSSSITQSTTTLKSTISTLKSIISTTKTSNEANKNSRYSFILLSVLCFVLLCNNI
ncbi:hypothetical protein [Ranid herpesvirus 3]|uniref:sialate O-acetylesterase n=1 Tax=Ranid herpesvirus 3 TaxID=1987509 RepID=A0A1X9T5G8_9VIRU|nr:hypothetical protein [Ranid herpesvirus 3]ARR28946.1 hypothetical protein [Ranid herpesvirus 3]